MEMYTKAERRLLDDLERVPVVDLVPVTVGASSVWEARHEGKRVAAAAFADGAAMHACDWAKREGLFQPVFRWRGVVMTSSDWFEHYRETRREAGAP